MLCYHIMAQIKALLHNESQICSESLITDLHSSINILLFKCCGIVLSTGAMIYVHYLCLAYFFTLYIKTKLQTLLLLLSLDKVFFL